MVDEETRRVDSPPQGGEGVSVPTKYSIADVEALLTTNPQKALEVMVRQMQEMHMRATLKEFAYEKSNPQESSRQGAIAKAIASAFVKFKKEDGRNGD